jgi:hypothetical protein
MAGKKIWGGGRAAVSLLIHGWWGLFLSFYMGGETLKISYCVGGCIIFKNSNYVGGVDLWIRKSWSLEDIMLRF